MTVLQLQDCLRSTATGSIGCASSSSSSSSSSRRSSRRRGWQTSAASSHQQQTQQEPHQHQQQQQQKHPEHPPPQQQAVIQQLTCRRCFQRFSSAENSSRACSYHPAMYTGGEVAKAIGFVRESSAPEHQLGAVVGRTGLMRFWDCCGAADEAAPGCEHGYHVSFDDELNTACGWKE